MHRWLLWVRLKLVLSDALICHPELVEGLSKGSLLSLPKGLVEGSLLRRGRPPGASLRRERLKSLLRRGRPLGSSPHRERLGSSLHRERLKSLLRRGRPPGSSLRRERLKPVLSDVLSLPKASSRGRYYVGND